MERVLWIDRFPIRVGIGPHGPWVACALKETTPYGASASALCEAINTTDRNRAEELRALRSGEGFSCEGASVLPLLSWGKERIAQMKRATKGYFAHVPDDELWLCRSFDDDDFVVIPYVTLLAILDVAVHFRAHGVLPPGWE